MINKFLPNVKIIVAMVAGFLLSVNISARAVTISTDYFTDFTIDFAHVGAGNLDDDTGYGSVDYFYRMAVNEVSEKMIADYNTYSGGPHIVVVQ